jgi:hypothetical protein
MRVYKTGVAKVRIEQDSVEECLQIKKNELLYYSID